MTKSKMQILDTKDLLVYREITYKSIRVIIKVDFIDMTVSLVERDNSFGRDKFRDKKWLFAGREQEYMSGWLDILEAMKIATKVGHDLLKERQELETSEKAEMMIELAKNRSNKNV